MAIKPHKTPYEWLGIGAIVLASILLLWPLFRQGFFVTDDGDWMIIRLSAFYQSLAEGQFPVRFLGRLYHNYGYPVANFLYPGFLYVGSFVRLFGFSYVDVIKIVLSISVVGSAVVLYATLRKKFQLFEATAGAVSFVLSPYVVFDLYKRGSVGELFAFLPASILFYGIVSNVLWVIPIATAVLIISHNSLALLFLGVFLLFSFMQNKRFLYIKSIAIGIGMATFFWLPALLERRFVLFDSVRVADSFSYFIQLHQWPLLGVGFIGSLVLLFFAKHKVTVFEKTSAVITLCSVALALPISTFIWKLIPQLSFYVQFPFRFLSVASFIGAFTVSSTLSVVPKKIKGVVVFILTGLLVYIALLSQSAIVYVDHGEGYYSTNEATTTVMNEYMPLWVQTIQTTRAAQKVEVLSGDAEFFSEKETVQRIDGIIDAKAESLISINTIYYPGWGVALNGVLTPIEYNNPNGVMHITVPKGKYRLEASFRETGFRLVTDIISLGFIILYFEWMIRMKFKP